MVVEQLGLHTGEHRGGEVEKKCTPKNATRVEERGLVV